jgi:hypothetical protein
MSELFELVKAQQNIMLSGMKNGELIGKRTGLELAAEICRKVAASYTGTFDSVKIHKSLAALECEAKILDEIGKLIPEYVSINADESGMETLAEVANQATMREMTADERLDDPRRGQAKELNK